MGVSSQPANVKCSGRPEGRQPGRITRAEESKFNPDSSVYGNFSLCTQREKGYSRKRQLV